MDSLIILVLLITIFTSLDVIFALWLSTRGLPRPLSPNMLRFLQIKGVLIGVYIFVYLAYMLLNKAEFVYLAVAILAINVALSLGYISDQLWNKK